MKPETLHERYINELNDLYDAGHATRAAPPKVDQSDSDDRADVGRSLLAIPAQAIQTA
jgi:hypothetical protein